MLQWFASPQALSVKKGSRQFTSDTSKWKKPTARKPTQPSVFGCKLWISSGDLLCSRRRLLIFAAVNQLGLKLTHLLLFNFNLYCTQNICQNIMFWAAIASLLLITRVLGMLHNAICWFLIALTRRGLGASLQLCEEGTDASVAELSVTVQHSTGADLCLIFLLTTESLKLHDCLELFKNACKGPCLHILHCAVQSETLEEAFSLAPYLCWACFWMPRNDKFGLYVFRGCICFLCKDWDSSPLKTTTTTKT